MGFKMTAMVRLVGIEHKIEALNPSYKKLSLETLILTDTGNRDLTKIRGSPESGDYQRVSGGYQRASGGYQRVLRRLSEGSPETYQRSLETIRGCPKTIRWFPETTRWSSETICSSPEAL